MDTYEITIEREHGGYYWKVALPKEKPNDIGMQISGWAFTLHGAKGEAKRCVKRQKNKQPPLTYRIEA